MRAFNFSLSQQPAGITQKQSVKENIENLLQSRDGTATQRSFRAKILEELQNFHQFYNQRYLELKQNYEKVNRVNWEYATKILKYEQSLENYNMLLKQNQLKIHQLQTQLSYAQNQRGGLTERLSQPNYDDTSIRNLLSNKENYHHERSTQKKIIKIKSKQKDENYIENIRTERTHISLEQQKQELQQYNKQLQNQILAMKRRVKHLEVDRKYEDERLKNATLELQLQLKIKNQQIQRLGNQREIYEKKFKKLLGTKKECEPLKSETDRVRIIDEEEEICQSIWDSQFRQKQSNQLTEIGESEPIEHKTHENVANRGHQTHRRHGSSNLQQHKKRHEDLQMKIKIFKYSKNRLRID